MIDEIKDNEKTSLGQAIIEGLTEARDYYLHKKTDKVRVTHLGKAELIALRTYSAQEVKEIRTRLGMTQEYFAEVMGIGVDAVRKWESKGKGGGIKSGPAIRMMQQLDKVGKIPDVLLSQA
jgi:DNA-binding transcriptional regulator YiaG